ncbi:TetR/AcrR family transcriptional regulator [Lacrimispora sp. 38-1]|uniref:TetR/AcrR family transcriptional regulator n=1 Tax=Lacrimispora sp. 38-1 TaxID=3125778 RepID=UPI003CF1E311
MNKSISKDQIIETALDLMKDRSDIRSINLREIARALGCAHTNLYNYFPSFNDLLWEAHIVIQKKIISELYVRLANMQDQSNKLQCFFSTLADQYLEHRGWFRLAWLDYIDDVRPDNDIIATEEAVSSMVEVLKNIWEDSCHEVVDREKIYWVLHNVHCYIIGEVSNYFNGRRLISDEEELKNHIADTCLMIFTLCLERSMIDRNAI